MATVYENYREGKLVSFKFKVYLGRYENGKQRLKYSTWHIPKGMTVTKARNLAKKKSEEWEREVLSSIEKDNSNSRVALDDPLFSTFVKEIWFDRYVCDGTHKPKTVEFYRYITDNIVSFFKGVRISGVSAEMIEQYLTFLRTGTTTRFGKPFSQKSIRHHYQTLNAVFKFAQQHDVVLSNPLEKVRIPRITRKKVDALDETQSIRFLNALRTEPIEMRCIVLLLLFVGIRRGELVGLKWGDIDFIRRTINIQRNVIYTKESGTIIGTPKTAESTRVIPLPSIVEDALNEYKRQQDGEITVEGFLFPGKGDPTSPRDPNAITRRLKRFVLRHELPDVSPHDLRHTCASLLLASGADIKSVQEILGHRDAATTLNYYAKSNLQQMQLASEMMVNRIK